MTLALFASDEEREAIEATALIWEGALQMMAEFHLRGHQPWVSKRADAVANRRSGVVSQLLFRSLPATAGRAIGHSADGKQGAPWVRRQERCSPRQPARWLWRGFSERECRKF